MGNLAERYGDPKRSGIYRVSSRRVPILAAGEAGADLHECSADDVEDKLTCPFWQAAGQSRGWPCILLVHDVTDVCRGDTTRATQLVRRLQAAFRGLGDVVDPCFVVIVDPLKMLDVPVLWREPVAT